MISTRVLYWSGNVVLFSCVILTILLKTTKLKTLVKEAHFMESSKNLKLKRSIDEALLGAETSPYTDNASTEATTTKESDKNETTAQVFYLLKYRLYLKNETDERIMIEQTSTTDVTTDSPFNDVTKDMQSGDGAIFEEAATSLSNAARTHSRLMEQFRSFLHSNKMYEKHPDEQPQLLPSRRNRLHTTTAVTTRLKKTFKSTNNDREEKDKTYTRGEFVSAVISAAQGGVLITLLICICVLAALCSKGAIAVGSSHKPTVEPLSKAHQSGLNQSNVAAKSKIRHNRSKKKIRNIESIEMGLVSSKVKHVERGNTEPGYGWKPRKRFCEEQPTKKPGGLLGIFSRAAESKKQEIEAKRKLNYLQKNDIVKLSING